MPALDGLRGLAIAAVLLFHADHLSGGFLGVDLFFVLSGFLITSLLLAEWRRRRRISLPAFWARRARRLLPALAGVLAGVAVYAAVFADPTELGRIRADALGTLGYVANWRAIFTGNGYWDAFAAQSPLEHTWSLAIEEQFYLVWPLVVLGVLRARRGSARALTATALVLAAASSAWMMVLYEPGTDPERVYLGTDTRGAAVLLGGALAAAFVAWGPPSRATTRRLVQAVGVAAAAALGWAWFALDGGDDALYRGGFLACSLAATAVIAAAADPHPGLLGRAFSLGPLRALGAISYGLYLWHWPVYVALTPKRTGIDGWSLTTLRIAVSIGFAVVSYYLLEMPIRRGALRNLRVRVLAPVGVATVAAVLLALVVTTAGAVSRPIVRQSSASAATNRTPAPLPPSTAATAVAFAPTLEPARVLIVGDSVAASLGQPMEAQSAALGITAWNRAIVDCGLNQRGDTNRLPDGGYLETHRNCGDGWAADVAAFQPDVAFLLLGAPTLSEVRLGDNWAHACMPEYDTWYRDRLTGAVDTLGSTGAHVVIGTAPVPVPFGSPEQTDCLDLVHREIAAARSNVAVVDLDAYVCPLDHCRTEIDGAELRPDGLHFEGEAALVVCRWVAERLLALSR